MEKQNQLGEEIVKLLKGIDANKLNENITKLEELIKQLESLKAQAESVKKSESTAEAGDVINNYIDNSTKIINNINNQIIVITEFYSTTREKIPKIIGGSKLTQEEEKEVTNLVSQLFTALSIMDSITDEVLPEGAEFLINIKKLLKTYSKQMKKLHETAVNNLKEYKKEKSKSNSEEANKLHYLFDFDLFKHALDTLDSMNSRLDKIRKIEIRMGSRRQVERTAERMEEGRTRTALSEESVLEESYSIKKMFYEIEENVVGSFERVVRISSVENYIENLQEWFYLTQQASFNLKYLERRLKGSLLPITENEVDSLKDLIDEEKNRLSKSKKDFEKITGENNPNEEEISNAINALTETIDYKDEEKTFKHFETVLKENINEKIRDYEVFTEFMTTYKDLLVRLFNSFVIDVLIKHGNKNKEDYVKFYFKKARRRGDIESSDLKTVFGHKKLNVSGARINSRKWKKLTKWSKVKKAI